MLQTNTHTCTVCVYMYVRLCNSACMIVYCMIDTVEGAEALQRQAEGRREASAKDC